MKEWIIIVFVCIAIVITVLVFIVLIKGDCQTYNKEKYKESNKFICNHYKFKSEEEYQKRQIEFNKGGYMKNKLSDKMNIKWKKRANSRDNFDITKYIIELKNQMKTPLIKNKKKIYNISVVSMFRYEDAYLEEWLHYCIMHGIDHFFLYSNNNTENTIKILQPFIDNGYVTLIEWKDDEILKIPENQRRKVWNDYHKISLQNLAFIDFVKNHKHKTKWIIKIDIDEFIYPLNTDLKIKDVLDHSTEKYHKVPRIDFGNNNHDKKPKGLIIQNYTKSELKPSGIQPIALTKFISKNDKGGAHSFEML